MNGLMGECMKANGKTTRCTGKEFSPGEMEGDMKENMSMIKKKGTAFLNGLMAEGTLANGKMENNMARELL